MKLHLLRNTIHYGSQYAWALSLTLLPLAMVFSLEFTMPAWTALLAAWLLNEQMTPSRIGVVVLGIVGVLVILRPGLADINPAVFLVLAAAFGYAIVDDRDQETHGDRKHVRDHLLDVGDPVADIADRLGPGRQSGRIPHLNAEAILPAARRSALPAPVRITASPMHFAPATPLSLCRSTSCAFR